MKELQAKYKDDRQRLNQEMMKLYQEHKVNPFASCLPLLAQLPVFIALFYLLRDDLRNEICGQNRAAVLRRDGGLEFFFIPDMTDAATGGVLITLLVLYVGSQLASSLLMSVSADPNQRYIFLALPFIFIPFVINFPAGLLVYWITTNLWTIVQQFIVRKTVGPVRPPDLGGGKKGGGDRRQAEGRAQGRRRAGGPRRSRRQGRRGCPVGTKPSAPPPPPSKRKKKRREAPLMPDGRAPAPMSCEAARARRRRARPRRRRVGRRGRRADRRPPRGRRSRAFSSAATARRSRPCSTSRSASWARRRR